MDKLKIIDEIKKFERFRDGVVAVHPGRYQDLAEAIIILYEQGETVPAEEVPILVGHLNREFGYNFFHPIPIGAEVFEFRDRYFFMMKPVKLGEPDVQQRFYKEDLKPCIDFISAS